MTKKGDYMIVVELRMMCLHVIRVEEEEREVRLFSSIEKSNEWLLDNGFYLGQRDFFRYRDNRKEWVHRNDKSWHYIDVHIFEYELDDLSDSEYKDFKVNPCPWGYEG